jgi:hypothetical protein
MNAHKRYKPRPDRKYNRAFKRLKKHGMRYAQLLHGPSLPVGIRIIPGAGKIRQVQLTYSKRMQLPRHVDLSASAKGFQDFLNNLTLDQ